ncbi:hypothetical protein FI667_g14909, partial [Globisporangium splendens]
MPKKPRVKQVPIQGSFTYLSVPKPAEADKARQDLVNILTKAFRICEVLEKHVDKCPDKLKRKRAKKALIRTAKGIVEASDGIGECFRRCNGALFTTVPKTRHTCLPQRKRSPNLEGEKNDLST